MPPVVRRAIYRVSALLETVDLEFERVLEQREAYRGAVEVLDTDEVLNVDLLEKVLDSLLPAKNKSEDEHYSELLRELTLLNVLRPRVLEDLIRRQLDAVLAAERGRVQSEQDNLSSGLGVLGTTEERTREGVFYTHTGLLRETLEQEFGKQRLQEARMLAGTERY